MDHPVAGVERRHEIDLGDTLRLSDTLVVHEKECAVFQDRTANSAAKLVPLERRSPEATGIFKVIGRVQPAIPEELVNATVEFVCSRACGGVDDTSRGLTVLGGIVARQDRELPNGIHAQVSSQHTAGCAIGVIVEANAI